MCRTVAFRVNIETYDSLFLNAGCLHHTTVTLLLHTYYMLHFSYASFTSVTLYLSVTSRLHLLHISGISITSLLYVIYICDTSLISVTSILHVCYISVSPPLMFQVPENRATRPSSVHLRYMSIAPPLHPRYMFQVPENQATLPSSVHLSSSNPNLLLHVRYTPVTCSRCQRIRPPCRRLSTSAPPTLTYCYISVTLLLHLCYISVTPPLHVPGARESGHSAVVCPPQLLQP